MQRTKRKLISVMYSVEDLFYWAKIKIVILNSEVCHDGSLQLFRYAVLHTLDVPADYQHLWWTLPFHLTSAERQSRGARSCFFWWLCEAGRCSRSIVPCARAAAPEHPGHESWWHTCRAWVSGAPWAWLCFPRVFLSTLWSVSSSVPVCCGIADSFSLVVICVWSSTALLS